MPLLKFNLESKRGPKGMGKLTRVKLQYNKTYVLEQDETDP